MERVRVRQGEGEIAHYPEILLIFNCINHHNSPSPSGRELEGGGNVLNAAQKNY
jgi:hypothetical protein